MKSIQELLAFGIIILDKPSGPTSHHVSDYVCKQLELQKTGHMGTLDPGVSGVLPITLNRACRLAPYLLNETKEYVGVMRLHAEVETSELKKSMKVFTGEINQLPPVRSNVKRALRKRTVYSFDYLEREGKDVLFYAEVEAGTYIRTLVNDLGKKLGGAHMLELRRTRAGLFNESDAITLYEFDKAVEAYQKGDEAMLRKIIKPAEECISQVFPVIEIKEINLKKILAGKPIHDNDLTTPVKKSLKKDERVAIFCKGNFVEIATLILKGDVIAKPEFVLN